MKIKCLYKGLWGDELTIGKEYEVIRKVDEQTYTIKMNDGTECDFFLTGYSGTKWFEIVEEDKDIRQQKSRIFIFSGSTACGKDTILNELSNGGVVKTLLSTTTRPIRATEKQGREYNFVTEEEFNRKEFVEKRVYNVANGDTWYYGLSYDEVFKCYNNFGNYAVILDVQGMRVLKEYVNKTFKDSIEVITIMLQASYHTRINRYLNRDRVTDDVVKEAIRRLNADMNEIEPHASQYDIVLKSEDEDLERNIKIIKSLCE